MRYMMLIYSDESLAESATEEDWQRTLVAHRKFGQEATERGMDPGGDALQPTSTAKTVRFDDNKPGLVIDGPFAETKEQLGGFYILTCESLDEAIEMAKKLPILQGSVEIRPVIDFD